MLYFLCSRMSRNCGPEIHVIWWNDGLLAHNVNVSNDQQPIQKSKWILHNYFSKIKKIEQNAGPWWCVYVCKSYNCRLKQIQGSGQLEVANSKCFFIF